MRIVKVSSLPLRDVISDIAKAFQTDYSENCTLYELELPPKIGHGTIRGIDFDDGLGLLDYDCTFNEEIQFEFSVDKVHPLKFLFCAEGVFTHKFENEKIWHEIPQYKNAIVASSEHNDHIIRFRQNQHTAIYSLELGRKDFQKKMSCELRNVSSPLKKLLNDTKAKETFYYDGFYSLQLADLFIEWDSFEEKHFVKKLYLEGLAYKILTLQIIQYQDDLKSEGKKTLLRKSEIRQLNNAVEIIDEELQDLPTVDEIAARVGLNPKKLQQGFQEILGSSVNNYVQAKRLNMAKTLLMTSEKSISEISEIIGYNSKSYLARIFKSEYGLSPSEYRIKMRGSYA